MDRLPEEILFLIYKFTVGTWLQREGEEKSWLHFRTNREIRKNWCLTSKKFYRISKEDIDDLLIGFRSWSPRDMCIIKRLPSEILSTIPDPYVESLKRSYPKTCMSLYHKFITEQEKERIVKYHRHSISKETIIQKITFLRQIRKTFIDDIKEFVIEESFLDSLASLMVDFHGCGRKTNIIFDDSSHWFTTIFGWAKKRVERERTPTLAIANIIFDIVILQVVLITLQSLVMDGMNPPVLDSNSLIIPNMRLNHIWSNKMRDFERKNFPRDFSTG